MNGRNWILSLVGLAVVVAALAITGCEDTSTSNTGITVTPSAVTMITTNNVGGAQVFTAAAANTNAAIFYPLVWSVTDPSLGRIAASGGASAVYTRTLKKGSNVITVRDQADSEGVAAVTQE